MSDVADSELQRSLASGRYQPVADAAALDEFDVALITVPTPLAEGVPDLGPITSAAERVGALVRPGCLVVLESTTYPGTTDELLAPLLEGASGLKTSVDFHVAYSPERIDPGNSEWTLVRIRIPKVVAGLTPGCLEAVDAFTAASSSAPCPSARRGRAHDHDQLTHVSPQMELIGDYGNGGTEWSPEGKPERVQVHDFADRALRRVRQGHSRRALRRRQQRRLGLDWRCR